MENARFMRSAAMWCAIGSLLALLLGVLGEISPDIFFRPPGGILQASVYVVVTIGNAMLLAGLVGLARADAVGGSVVGRIALGVAVLGWALFVPGELAEFAPQPKIVAITLFGIGTVFNVLGLIAAGVVVLRARRWLGWHGWTPLLWGLYPVVVLAAFGISGLRDSLLLGGWGVPSLLLSAALWQEAGERKAIQPGLVGQG